MARPLRIEYAGAHYHVMNRGNGRQVVFTEARGSSGDTILIREGVFC
jgi:hypothetical protein